MTLEYENEQPPTPDVEKISHVVNESTGDDILSMVMDFQNGRATASQLMDRIAARCEAFGAQARAPLVARLESIREFIGTDTHSISLTREGVLAILGEIDAALTGTGDHTK